MEMGQNNGQWEKSGIFPLDKITYINEDGTKWKTCKSDKVSFDQFYTHQNMLSKRVPPGEEVTTASATLPPGRVVVVQWGRAHSGSIVKQVKLVVPVNII
jgi:hypothetical protein